MMTTEWNLWEDAPAAGEGSTGDRGKNKAGECSGVLGGAVDPRERHKLAERERRKSMRELFLSLHSLLPHASTVRKEHSAILDEIIKYIPIAAARLRALESRRLQTSSDVRSNLTSSSSSSYNHNGGNATGACRSSTPRKRSRITKDGGGGGDTGDSADCEIRVAPDPASTVAIRVRGDRVNVSLTDPRGASSAQAILLSAVLDELEAHQLHLVWCTHCRDGSKLLHHSESKIREAVDGTPGLLKARLQELAGKLHGMRKTPAAAVKRAPNRHYSVEEDST